MCLWLLKKGVGSGVGSWSGFGAGSSPLIRGTDPGIRIRIRAKMSRIPNTCLWCICNCVCEVSIRLIWSVCITIFSKPASSGKDIVPLILFKFSTFTYKPTCTAQIRETKTSKILKMFKYKKFNPKVPIYDDKIWMNFFKSISIETIFYPFDCGRTGRKIWQKE